MISRRVAGCVHKPKGKTKMSKKKDPNIVLRDKRLRALVRQKKYAAQATSRFGCPFLDRMVDENYDLIERVIKLEHFIWNVRVEEEAFIFDGFTDAANSLAKKDRDLLVRQHKHMSAYEATLEQRMGRICERLETDRNEAERSKPEAK